MCRELSVSDTEASEVTWTDNGTFNLSEGHTPQTENSEGELVCPVSFLYGVLCFFCAVADKRKHLAYKSVD